MPDLEAGLREAVRRFWRTRGDQSTRQGSQDDRDRGARSAVTGGQQMNGFVDVVRDALISRSVPAESIALKARVELPGWFRAEKKWDLLIVHQGELLAALEFKSQVGPSFGNNFNNRTEEALGSATDIWAAYREGAFRVSRRPFLGYLMLLEDCPQSRSAVKVSEPHFPVFPEFHDASYAKRYAILIEKLLRERLYDGACLLTSSESDAASGDCAQPHPELTFERFLDSLLAHVGQAIRAPREG
jgi:hypothetical protein